MTKYSVGYVISYNGNEWAAVRSLDGDYTQEEAKQLLEEMINEGMIAFQDPPVYSHDGLPELRLFHDAMIDQIKDMLDELESVHGEEIYDKYENMLCEVQNFHSARRMLEVLVQEKHNNELVTT